MFTSEKSADDKSADDKSADDKSADDNAGGDRRVDSINNMHSLNDKATDIASGRKTTRPKVTLLAIVTCPDCGDTNKPEWMNKSRHSDSYATTVYCEQCGSMIAIW